MCMNVKYIKVPDTNLSIFSPTQEYISVPCGKCDECRVSNSKEWGVRCMCELSSLDEEAYNNSWFITLTYDDEHNPGHLKERDMQLFIKRLRKCFKNNKIKYFYCGEYGSKTYRPHYHMIVFNVPLKQMKYKQTNFNGDIIWDNKQLTKLWGNGSVVVGTVSMKSASYTARYCLKKNITDCYMRCSQGFGKKFFFDHLDDIIANGYISVPVDNKIIKAKIPKYFLKLYRKYLDNDDEYSKFLRWRNEQMSKFQGKLIEKMKLPTDIPLLRWSDLGNQHPALLVNCERKRIIKQALMDLYHFRDNF